jgi:hypothetical protein
MKLSEDNMELVDAGDSMEFEIWEDQDGQLYNVPVERASDDEEAEMGEVRIERDFDNAEKVVESVEEVKIEESVASNKMMNFKDFLKK